MSYFTGLACYLRLIVVMVQLSKSRKAARLNRIIVTWKHLVTHCHCITHCHGHHVVGLDGSTLYTDGFSNLS